MGCVGPPGSNQHEAPPLTSRRSLPARVGGEPEWPTSYGKIDQRTDHPIQSGPPGTRLGTVERLRANGASSEGRRVYVKARVGSPPNGGIPVTSPLTALRGSFFFPARQAVSLRLLARWSRVGPLPQERGRSPTTGAGSGANASCALCPVVTEVRGAFWSPALVESVDRWPLASPDTKIPGGSRPVVAAVRRRCPRGPVPSPEGRMPQATSARKGVIWRHFVRTGT